MGREKRLNHNLLGRKKLFSFKKLGVELGGRQGQKLHGEKKKHIIVLLNLFNKSGIFTKKKFPSKGAEGSLAYMDNYSL